MKTLAEIYDYYAKRRGDFPSGINIVYHKYLPDYLPGHDILSMRDSDDYIFSSLRIIDDAYVVTIHMYGKIFSSSFDFNLNTFSAKLIDHRVDFESECDVVKSYIDCTYTALCIVRNFAEDRMNCIDGSNLD